VPAVRTNRNGAFSVPGIIVWLATLAGLALSVAALLKICSSCSETAQYRVFGMDFGWFGIAYFVVLTLAVALRRRHFVFGWISSLLFFASAGAEAHFIWIQKYEIGQWCPICLSIAAAVFIACAGISCDTFRIYTLKGATMKTKMMYILLVSAFFVMGLGTAVLGVKKDADAAELDLFLGKGSSATTVYFVSDWFCPVCIKIEPVIEKMFPEVAKSAKIGFVDFPIHKETINYTPYNIYFLTHEKAKYIGIRKALSALAFKSKNPTDSEVKAAVAPLGVKLKKIDNSDTLFGMQSNLMVYRGYNVNSTPSVVITNSKTKKTRLLVGDTQISELSVKAAITEVEKR